MEGSIACFVEIEGERVYSVNLSEIVDSELKVQVWMDGMLVWCKFPSSASYRSFLETGAEQDVLFKAEAKVSSWFEGKIYYKIVDN